MSYNITNCLGVIKEMFFPTAPKYTELTFTAEAYAKLMCYIHLIGEYEITGFGRIVDNKIVDIAILKQTVKSAKVDCDVDAMLEFLTSIPEDQEGQWVLDWHSHVNMGVFESGTDSDNYEEQWEARLHEQYPVMIVNKKQQIYSKCYINPSRKTDIKVFVEKEGLSNDRLVEIYNECAVNVQTLCKKEEWKQQNTQTYYNNGFGFHSNYYNDYDGWENGETVYMSNYKKKQEETEKEEQNADSYIDDNFCSSCGQYLVSPEEYDRCICDDCWELMPFEDREQWLKALRQSY